MADIAESVVKGPLPHTDPPEACAVSVWLPLETSTPGHEEVDGGGGGGGDGGMDWMVLSVTVICAEQLVCPPGPKNVSLWVCMPDIPLEIL